MRFLCAHTVVPTTVFSHIFIIYNDVIYVYILYNIYYILYHICVFVGQGSVYSVGSNQEGQLGLGHCNNTTSFHLLQPFCGHAPIKMLSAGYNTSAALTGSE